ncbi:FAD/NAD-P-binding domain-containing protein [Mycena olivaceomarginata]|nr:FAD/NAD-P-binding domain-containing protein [Mycena olivaceomarginata]
MAARPCLCYIMRLAVVAQLRSTGCQGQSGNICVSWGWSSVEPQWMKKRRERSRRGYARWGWNQRNYRPNLKTYSRRLNHSGPLFDHPIRRVAVVGAGPAGLQAAAKLIEHNFTVRLFERAPHPGGNWLYSEETPGRRLRYLPSSRVTRYYNEDGRSTGNLVPLWKSLHINTPKVSTELPDVKYDPDTPWVVSHHAVQRHVRSYASHHCLNSNDYCPATASAPPATAYSTRVEKVEKNMEAHTWVLTLRRLERLHESHRILAEWWTETFDAVVLATGPYTAPHVPDIDGIVDWSKATEGGQYSVYHSQTVLIVGASVSASEIARDIGSFAHRIIASVRYAKHSGSSTSQDSPTSQNSYPKSRSWSLSVDTVTASAARKIHLINGSVLQGIDEIILATGIPRLFLVSSQFVSIRSIRFNSYSHKIPNNHARTTKRPEDIHWTGHYIPDPTLAYTFGRPWTLGRYQSYGLAKVWEGSARLPTSEQMKLEEEYWREWLGEEVFRRYITWLNNASLEHGGRFVEPPPIENLEILKYYMFVYLLNVSQLGDKDAWDALVDEDDDW